MNSANPPLATILMAKTGSIKERSIYVYLPSVEMTEHWKANAKKAHVSISQFVLEHVTDSLHRPSITKESLEECRRFLQTYGERT